MKNSFFIFLLICNINFLYSEIEFRQATQADIPGIIKLMNSESTCKDIYPKKRRSSTLNVILKSAIDSKSIFVAVDITSSCCRSIGKIIGFEKLSLKYEIPVLTIEIEACCNNQYKSSAINKGLLDLALNALLLNEYKKDLSKICFAFKNSCKDEAKDSIKDFMDTVNTDRKHAQKVQFECIEFKQDA